MRRLSVLCLLVLGSILVASQLASADSNPSHAHVEIKLKASNGLSARLENEDDKVSLTIRGHRQFVDYTAHGEVSPDGVEVRFGKLGEVSVEFRPTRTVESTKPSPECEGEPWTTKVGVFVGTIRFRGERGYVEIDSSRARGEMRVTPDWKCAYRYRGEEEEGDLATLTARQPGLHRVFSAGAIRDPDEGNYTFFVGATVEHREGTRISRAAFAVARASAFTFNHKQGSAAVSPPWPFRGSAKYRRAERGPDSWQGSLRAPLLGAGMVALAGKGFSASLKRDFPGD